MNKNDLRKLGKRQLKGKCKQNDASRNGFNHQEDLVRLIQIYSFGEFTQVELLLP
jgi:hypothetical protein